METFKKMSNDISSLHANPFYILRVNTRDNNLKIVEAAEERSLLIDQDICQNARSILTNPRTRLGAEMGWMPGVAPNRAEQLVKLIENNPIAARSDSGISKLARANLMAAAFESVKDDESVNSIAEFIRDFCFLVEHIDPEEIMRDINEDRAISGFPEVRSIEQVIDELVTRRKSYCSILKQALNQMHSENLVAIVTMAVTIATDNGKNHGPALLDDMVDSYEIETQGFLQNEYEILSTLIKDIKEAAPNGEMAVSPILDKLEKVARNWDKVAQPIQLSAKSRGTVHIQSRNVAIELRGLGIDLNNDYGLLLQADRMTKLLQDIFAELPEILERLDEDAKAIADLQKQSEQRKKDYAEWERSINFSAEVGLIFKTRLSISKDGILWEGSRYPLEAIAHVRWGGIRRSINGIPTGTDYTVAFGGNHSEVVIHLRKESTYSGFIDALWRGVCVRLAIEMLQALSNGKSFSFGDIMVEDSVVTLTRHKFFGKERVRLTWNDVHIWTANGSFCIGHKDERSLFGSASYIDHANTHIFEHIIRGAFKKGANKLSDYLK